MTIINRWSDDIGCPDNNPIYVENPSDEIWTMKSGKTIRVGDMTNNHILNAFHYFKDKNKNWANIFEFELSKRNLK